LALFLGLLAGVTYGAADFIGGLASRRSSVFAVVVISQVAGLLLLLAGIPLFPAAHPQASDFLWGSFAGLAGALGIVLLYRGLAIGRMSLVSPITAVMGAVIPFIVGLALHERPSSFAICGVIIALVAVVLVSSTEADPALPGLRIHGWLRQPGLLEAALSGVGIGLFYVFLAHSRHDSGMWPLASSRLTSSFVITIVALGTRQALVPAAGAWGGIVFAGVLDVAANGFYLLATRHGMLAIVAVLASLYPASTVILARLFLRERLTPVQLSGVACALVAIALIGAGR
jgi:drug/metabolite transporter (DMT)-like permease